MPSWSLKKMQRPMLPCFGEKGEPFVQVGITKYAAFLADPKKFQKEIIEDLAFPPGANPSPRGPWGLLDLN